MISGRSSEVVINVLLKNSSHVLENSLVRRVKLDTLEFKSILLFLTDHLNSTLKTQQKSHRTKGL